MTAVDRLQRFRWSGGGNSNNSRDGNAGKKNGTAGRNSDKTERLRELTEKLKGPAPVPPPRRPSKFQASSPESCHSYNVNSSQVKIILFTFILLQKLLRQGCLMMT